ncbi:MAG: hypothetical protein ABSE69_08895 [Roseiarcus sp.]|jgi:hypothetical protein
MKPLPARGPLVRISLLSDVAPMALSEKDRLAPPTVCSLRTGAPDKLDARRRLGPRCEAGEQGVRAQRAVGRHVNAGAGLRRATAADLAGSSPSTNLDMAGGAQR